MAIDTAEKRASISGISLPFLAPGVTPNASPDQEWRQESAWSYSGILAAAPAGFTWSWALEAYISAAWVDITDDVLTHNQPTVISRGIENNGVTNRVASPGSLTTALDNSKYNSGGLDGYYSLGHANQRANFGRDTRLRLKVTFNGTPYYKWYGWIRSMEPDPNRFGKRQCNLSAFDYMQKLVEHKISGIPVQENQRDDQLFSTVLANVPTQPLNTSISTGTFTTPLALHSEQDERSTAMSVIQKLCQSFMRYCYLTDDETLVFQREFERMTSTPVATFDNTMSELKIEDDPDRIRNKVIGTIALAEVDSGADTLLAELTQDYPLEAGDTKVIQLRLRDPEGRANRMSAKNIVTTLTPNVHYRASVQSDTELNDMTDLLSVTYDAGGNTVAATVTNNGSVRMYINLLKVFGDGIYLYEPVEVIVESGDADRAMTYDLYYISDPYRAKDMITVVHRRTSAGNLEIESLVFYADASATLMGYAMNADIGDRLQALEYMTGLNGEYVINYVTFSFDTDGRLRVEWKLEFAESFSLFTIEDPVLGEIDNTSYVLSPL